MTKVVLQDLNLTRGTTPILRNVNLTVEDGEFCVFVGPSGCGKSTLLRLIAGLDSDATGRIAIGGHDVSKVPPAQRNVAMVFQGYALYPHMTVRQNMAFALKRAGRPKPEIERRVAEASRILKLDELLDRLPSKLSGGQRQRVAIGRAIVKDPKVFLFDEPLSNLDAGLRVETRIEIAKLHRDLGTASMIYVTHDQVEALTLADKIVLLRPVLGDPAAQSVVQIGSPMDLYHRPANLFAARFIGSPGMNLLPGRVVQLSDQGVRVEVGGAEWLARVAPEGLVLGEPVTVGLRPEHVQVGTASSGCLPARVSHIEALGEHCVLYLRIEGQPEAFLAKTTAEHFQADDPVLLGAQPQHLHVFRADGSALARRQ